MIFALTRTEWFHANVWYSCKYHKQFWISHCLNARFVMDNDHLCPFPISTGILHPKSFYSADCSICAGASWQPVFRTRYSAVWGLQYTGECQLQLIEWTTTIGLTKKLCILPLGLCLASNACVIDEKVFGASLSKCDDDDDDDVDDDLITTLCLKCSAKLCGWCMIYTPEIEWFTIGWWN